KVPCSNGSARGGRERTVSHIDVLSSLIAFIVNHVHCSRTLNAHVIPIPPANPAQWRPGSQMAHGMEGERRPAEAYSFFCSCSALPSLDSLPAPWLPPSKAVSRRLPVPPA